MLITLIFPAKLPVHFGDNGEVHTMATLIRQRMSQSVAAIVAAWAATTAAATAASSSARHSSMVRQKYPKILVNTEAHPVPPADG